MKHKIIFQNKKKYFQFKQLSDANFFSRWTYLPLSAIFRWQKNSIFSQPGAFSQRVGRKGEGLLKGFLHNLQSPRNSSTKLPSSYLLACRKKLLLLWWGNEKSTKKTANFPTFKCFHNLIFDYQLKCIAQCNSTMSGKQILLRVPHSKQAFS